MVNLTKSINAVSGAVQKTMGQVSASKVANKAETTVSQASQKTAEDIKKIEAMAECIKVQSQANIPDYIYDIIRKLGR